MITTETMLAAVMVLLCLLTFVLVAQVITNNRLRKQADQLQDDFNKQTDNFLQLSKSATHLISKIQESNDAFTAIIAHQEATIAMFTQKREEEVAATQIAFQRYIKDKQERNAKYPGNPNWPNPAS